MSVQNLKDVLADLIPKEQNRIKNFKQQYGKTNIGQITVDMVSVFQMGSGLHHRCDGSASWQLQLILKKAQIAWDARSRKVLGWVEKVVERSSAPKEGDTTDSQLTLSTNYCKISGS